MHYLWNSLGGDTGTQSQEDVQYGDAERHEIRRLFAHTPTRILDIGCTRGGVGAGLKRDFGAYVWGVELNQDVAKVAATRLDKVTTAPLESFGPEEIALLQTIDTVCLLDVLEHMYNPWGALAFLEKYLPKHAQILVSLPNVANAELMQDMASGYWRYKSYGLLDITHIRFFTPYEMDKMMCETGYTIEDVLFSPGVFDRQMELTAQSEYPVWKMFGNIQILVRDYEHWMQLHMVQMIFRAKITPDDQLSELSRAKRFDPHPPTISF